MYDFEPDVVYTVSSSKSLRTMVLVITGNFCAPRRKASFAMANETPSISKRILPGFTLATKYSGAPFSFTHTDFSRLFGDGLVGEYTNPELSFTFHVTRDGLTG